MRVFLSHNREDEDAAREIRRLLADAGIPAFLDLLDPGAAATSLACVTSYLIARIEGCTHLMPVLGEGSVGSWWLPFSLGVAAEKGRVVAPYVRASVAVPDFLAPWPVLRHAAHLRAFMALGRLKAHVFREADAFGKSRTERRTEARSFELALKRRLDGESFPASAGGDSFRGR